METQTRSSEEVSSESSNACGQTLNDGGGASGKPTSDAVLETRTDSAGGGSSDDNERGEVSEAQTKASNAVSAPSDADARNASEKREGGKKRSSEKPPLPPAHPKTKRDAPPLPKRPIPVPNRRQRSHSMDNADLSNLQVLGNSDEIADAGFVPSSASTGMLDTSDRFEAHDEPTGFPPDVLDALSNPHLEDDTPAAAALRANANVHVSNVSKLARRMKAQNIRRFVKRAALIGKSGHVRGKPPRAPPFRGGENDVIGGSMPNIYALKEEEGGDDFMDSSIDSEHEPSVGESTDSQGALKIGECINSAPTFIQQRAASQPTLGLDNWRQDDHQQTVDTHDTPEKDSAVVSRVKIHSSATDGIPSEVHTSPEGKGIGKLHIGPHLMAWKRRKAKKQRGKRKSYVKGKVIDGQHELYTLSIAVMLGLRTSIGMTNAQMNEKNGRKGLELEAFKQTEKYVFRPKGGPKTPPHQLSHTFKFKDYCPLVFAYMRRMFGINEFEFLLSVCGNANFIEFISNAKSGQFFFYSYDGKYMIKTMTNAESKFLRRILPDYFRHCSQNPNTLITKFLGMYRVKLYHLRRNVKFVIMNSVFDTDKVIKSLYDLKGSVTGRDAKPHQDVKKDNDFRRRRPDSVLALNPEVRSRVREQIVRDCEFFKKMHIMDYSMLVGVHYVPPKHKFMGDQSRLSFRDSLRDAVGSRKKTSQRLSHPEDQMGSVGAGGEISMKSDKAFQTPAGKALEKHTGGSAAVPKSPTPGRKTSFATTQSVASINSDTGLFGGDATVDTLHTLDYMFEEDDDDSYLEYSNVTSTKAATEAGIMPSVTTPARYLVTKENSQGGLPGPLSFNLPGCNEEGSLSEKLDDIELKKQQTTQQMFWPYHRFYDIHGRRRMVPLRCPECEEVHCSCAENSKDYKNWDIAPFVPPLSNRKDGGMMMDMTGVDSPLKTRLPNGNAVVCEGKIFYMGIIDILQQFNSRKRAEAVLRRYQGSGWQDASCVHPDIYADRFVSFFDECTQRDPSLTGGKGERSLPSNRPGPADKPSSRVEEEGGSYKNETSEEEKAEIEPPPESDVETPKMKTKGHAGVEAGNEKND